MTKGNNASTDATNSKTCHVEKEMTTMLEITYSKKHKTAKRHSPFVIVMKEADSWSILL